jgi:uncharacterized protein YbaP (TraB family)
MNSKQEKAMLTDRNKNWAEKMPDMKKKVLSLQWEVLILWEKTESLNSRAKGYTVKPISNL